MQPDDKSNSSAPPVVTAIGSVAAQPEVDKTAISEESQAVATHGAEIPAPTPVATIPDASQQPVSQPSNKVVALPVPTSLLPAFLIGSLILVLFLAVVLYAFVL